MDVMESPLLQKTKPADRFWQSAPAIHWCRCQFGSPNRSWQDVAPRQCAVPIPAQLKDCPDFRVNENGTAPFTENSGIPLAFSHKIPDRPSRYENTRQQNRTVACNFL